MEFLFKRGFVLPVVVTGAIPATAVVLTEAYQGLSPWFMIPGIFVYCLGLLLLIQTTSLFASHGGHLAPWNPPTDVVLVGPYQRSRNPMITGIVLMLGGEAIFFSSPWLGGWCAFFALAKHIYICFDEEPLLAKRFGESYEEYRRTVPRWIPRLKI